MWRGWNSGPHPCTSSTWWLLPRRLISSVLYLSCLAILCLSVCIRPWFMGMHVHICWKDKEEDVRFYEEMPQRMTATRTVTISVDFTCLFCLFFFRARICICYSLHKWHVVVIAIYHGCFPTSLNHLLQSAFWDLPRIPLHKCNHNLLISVFCWAFGWC